MINDTEPGICASCDKEVPTYDIGAYDSSRFCKDCIRKYGSKQLEAAANAALAARKVPKVRTTCIRCDTALVPGISVGLMCHPCNQVYKDTFFKDVRWG